MATATKLPADYTMTLTLDRDEAEFLRFIVGCIGGCKATSPRRFADAIYKAMDGAGVEKPDFKTAVGRDEIHFLSHSA